MDWILLDKIGIFKVEHAAGKYKTLLWTFSTLLVEELSEEEALKRTNELNRSTEHSKEGLLKILTTIPKESILSIDGDKSILRLKYYIDRIPFRYEWFIRPSDQELQEITHSITIPLLASLKQSRERERELLKVLQTKEDELNDYRGQNVALSNKFLETEEFKADKFKTEQPFSFLGDPENDLYLAKILPTTESTPVLAQNSIADPPISISNMQTKKRKKDNKLLVRTVQLKYSQADSQDSEDPAACDLLMPLELPPEKPSQPAKKKRRLADLL